MLPHLQGMTREEREDQLVYDLMRDRETFHTKTPEEQQLILCVDLKTYLPAKIYNKYDFDRNWCVSEISEKKKKKQGRLCKQLTAYLRGTDKRVHCIMNTHVSTILVNRKQWESANISDEYKPKGAHYGNPSYKLGVLDPIGISTRMLRERRRFRKDMRLRIKKNYGYIYRHYREADTAERNRLYEKHRKIHLESKQDKQTT